MASGEEKRGPEERFPTVRGEEVEGEVILERLTIILEGFVVEVKRLEGDLRLLRGEVEMERVMLLITDSRDEENGEEGGEAAEVDERKSETEIEGVAEEGFTTSRTTARRSTSGWVRITSPK